MRVLHTADWHLGHRLAGFDRMEEHRLFLQWLLQTLRDEAIDVLVVAGDVFDSAHPPQATMQYYYDFLRDLSLGQGPSCQAVIVAGNHDSPAHLDAPAGLLKTFGIHVVGSPSPDPACDIIELRKGDAEDSPSVAVCAIPYLRDRDVLKVITGEAVGEREERLREGVYQYYHQMGALTNSYRRRKIPVLATGHLTVRESSARKGEDDQIGTLSTLQATRFPATFDYLALGHLHAPHAVGESEAEDISVIRYAGAPIPMSFGEAEQTKSVVVLDFCEGRLQRCETVAIPVFRRLLRYQGDLENLPQWLAQNRAEIDDTLTPWIEVRLTDIGSPQLSKKVQELVDDEPFEVLKVLSEGEHGGGLSWESGEGARQLRDYTPQEVFAERLKAARIQDDADLQETFAELLALRESRKREPID